MQHTWINVFTAVFISGYLLSHAFEWSTCSRLNGKTVPRTQKLVLFFIALLIMLQAANAFHCKGGKNDKDNNSTSGLSDADKSEARGTEGLPTSELQGGGSPPSMGHSQNHA
jgi:hypothetical protein